MKLGTVNRTQKRAPMHLADTEIDLFTGWVPGLSGIDDLEEEEINRLFETLEQSLALGSTEAD